MGVEKSAKLYRFQFAFTHKGETQTLPIEAESVREAKALAQSLVEGLYYTHDYDEVEPAQAVDFADKFAGQQIAWICAKPVEELPFPFKSLKQAALLFAYGTNCQCCLGYRIMAALGLGSVFGYVVG